MTLVSLPYLQKNLPFTLDDLMIINRSGIIIRLAIADLRIIGRATQGVRLINLKDEDSIAAVAKVEISEEELVEEADIVENNISLNEEPTGESEDVASQIPED